MKKLLTISLSILVLTIFIACSSDDSSSPTVSDIYYQSDIAQMVAESFNMNTTTGSEGEITDMQEGAKSSIDGTISKAPQSHVVTHTNAWGYATHTVEYAFYNVSGTEETAYDPITTATVNFNATVAGSFSKTTPVNKTNEFTRRNNLVFSGLEGTNSTVILNGSGSCSAHHTFTSLIGNEQRYFDAEKTHTYSNIVISTDLTNSPYPLSGVATYTINAVKRKITDLTTKEKEFQATVVVTFNGTATPVLEITISGVMKKFNINLLDASITEKLN